MRHMAVEAATTRADVSKVHHALREAPYEANRVLALLSKMFNLAEAWDVRPDGAREDNRCSPPPRGGLPPVNC